jgi:hypothetical protein
VTEKNALANFLDGVKKMKDQQGEDQADDLNILPMPSSQEVNPGKWIKWTWNTAFEAKVFGILYLNDHEDGKLFNEKGSYEVQLSMNYEHRLFILTPADARDIGQAMVSASNWVNIWKDHAGYFMEKELMGE